MNILGHASPGSIHYPQLVESLKNKGIVKAFSSKGAGSNRIYFLGAKATIYTLGDIWDKAKGRYIDIGLNPKELQLADTKFIAVGESNDFFIRNTGETVVLGPKKDQFDPLTKIRKVESLSVCGKNLLVLTKSGILYIYEICRQEQIKFNGEEQIKLKNKKQIELNTKEQIKLKNKKQIELKNKLFYSPDHKLIFEVIAGSKVFLVLDKGGNLFKYDYKDFIPQRIAKITIETPEQSSFHKNLHNKFNGPYKDIEVIL